MLSCLKVRWSDDEHYPEKLLQLIFKDFGKVVQIVQEKDKKAIIKFMNAESVDLCLKSRQELLPLVIKSYIKEELRNKDRKSNGKIDLTLNT